MADWQTPADTEESWLTTFIRWILQFGFWDDTGFWVDFALWRDGPRAPYTDPADNDEDWDDVTIPDDVWQAQTPPDQDWGDV